MLNLKGRMAEQKKRLADYWQLIVTAIGIVCTLSVTQYRVGAAEERIKDMENEAKSLRNEISDMRTQMARVETMVSYIQGWVRDQQNKGR